MDDLFNNEEEKLEPAIPEADAPSQEIPKQSDPINAANKYSSIPLNSTGQYYEPVTPQEKPIRSEVRRDDDDTTSSDIYGLNNQYHNYYPPQPPQSIPNPYAAPLQEPQPKNKPKKNKSIITLIVVLVIAAAVAIGGIVIASSGNSSSNDKPESETTTSSAKGDSDAEAKVEKSNSAAKKDKDGNYTVAGVAESNVDSCVGITVFTNQSAYDYFYSYGFDSNGSGGNTASGEGSGVIMSESNGKTYIMTCAHVISDGSSFKVTLENGKEYDAEMVGADSQTDIGVLAISATGLQVAKFGNSDDIEVGEDCVAIGCPGGLEFMNSVTKGIVSALDRPVQSSIGYSNECIQVDAAINPGNSGGALFNMQGQVIGINSSKIASTEYEGMGFAVPSNTAVETANALIKNGYVAGRAKLGIEYLTLENFQNSSAILSALEEKGFKNAQGTMVIQNVSADSDLKDKDIKQYDMIVAVEGKTLTSTDVMTSLLSKKTPGDTITLTIARIEGNSINTFEVKCKLIESK